MTIRPTGNNTNAHLISTALDRILEDSVTYEPLTKAVVLNCGHSLNESTVLELKQDSAKYLCPECRIPITIYIPCIALRNIAESTSSVKKTEEYFTEGRSLCEQGKQEEGVLLLFKALELNPNHEKAQQYLDYVTSPKYPSKPTFVNEASSLKMNGDKSVVHLSRPATMNTENRIVKAIQGGNELEVEKFLKQGGPVNQFDGEGHNLIFHARTDSMVKLLLIGGAIIRPEPPQPGYTNESLFKLVEKNQLANVKNLLEYGLCNVNAVMPTPLGKGKTKTYTVLRTAIKVSPIMMLLLLRAGAMTHQKIVTCLITDQLADTIQVINMRIGATQIQWKDALLTKAGVIKIIQAITPRLKTNFPEYYALLEKSNRITFSFVLPDHDNKFHAILAGNAHKPWEITIALTKRNVASLYIDSLRRLSPEIIEHASPERLEKLFGLNTYNEQGETPLTASCSLGDDLIEVTRFLISQKPDLNLWNSSGESPLMLASKKNALYTIELLLENKACINHQNRDGTTPLLTACQNNAVDSVRLLIERGADIHLPDNKGVSPLSFMQNDKEVYGGILCDISDTILVNNCIIS